MSWCALGHFPTRRPTQTAENKHAPGGRIAAQSILKLLMVK